MSAPEESNAKDRQRSDSDMAVPTEMNRAADGDTSGSGNNDATAVSGSSGSLIGRRLGDFQVLRKLGRGGMADVYVARQLSLGRDVALKVLKNEFARDKDYVERFRREARAAAKLNHPNIVQVYDVGSADSMHYIAQELVDGENLREVLARVGTLKANEAIEVLVSVASALEVASEAGITHRDIKPENIMRSSRGIVKVADFGLARVGADAGKSRADLTQAGLTLGTPRYMSPEQVQGQVADVRSDLYSLGVSMYHLLAGRPPFEADDPLALAVLHLHETPMPLDRARGRQSADKPDLPEWLIAVVSRLLKKLPKDRFQSPSELLDAVRNEASESELNRFGTVGTAAATIRLQRVTDNLRRNQRRRVMRISAAVLLPLLCVAVTTTAAMQRPGKSIQTVLLPEEVPQADTVQEQYLIAVTRNDEAGWRAVGEYFSAKSTTNAAYHAKAMLQLALLLTGENRWQDADQVLNELLTDPTVDRLYQAVALARRCQVLERLGGGKQLTDARQRLKSFYLELQRSNPQVSEIFNDIVPQEERLRLGIGTTSNST